MKNAGLGKAQVQILRDAWRFRDEGGCPLDSRDRQVARRLEKRGLVRIPDWDNAEITTAGEQMLREIDNGRA